MNNSIFIANCNSIHEYKRMIKSTTKKNDFEVVRAVLLQWHDYTRLINHIGDKDIPYINSHLGEMSVVDGVYKVLMIYCLHSDKILLIMQENKHSPRYIGFWFNDSFSVETARPHKCRRKVVFVEDDSMVESSLKNQVYSSKI